MGELVQVQEAIEGEVVTGDCSLTYPVCTNTGVELVEDPYEADVNNNPEQLIMECPECLQDLSNDI